jgi:hypothetical protein
MAAAAAANATWVLVPAPHVPLRPMRSLDGLSMQQHHQQPYQQQPQHQAPMLHAEEEAALSFSLWQGDASEHPAAQQPPWDAGAAEQASLLGSAMLGGLSPFATPPLALDAPAPMGSPTGYLAMSGGSRASSQQAALHLRGSQVGGASQTQQGGGAGTWAAAGVVPAGAAAAMARPGSYDTMLSEPAYRLFGSPTGPWLPEAAVAATAVVAVPGSVGAGAGVAAAAGPLAAQAQPSQASGQQLQQLQQLQHLRAQQQLLKQQQQLLQMQQREVEQQLMLAGEPPVQQQPPPPPPGLVLGAGLAQPQGQQARAAAVDVEVSSGELHDVLAALRLDP